MEVNRLGPAVNGIEPEYTRLHTRPVCNYRQLLAHTSAFHRRFVGYHRPPRRLRPTPVHCASLFLAHIALRLDAERCVCSGCFRGLR